MASQNPTVGHMSTHILSLLSAHRSSYTSPPPLFVAIQGPQGSGKTYLTSGLKDVLTSQPHNLNVVVLSLDDLYLTHSGLKELRDANPGNRLLAGRGLPGTHDIPLGSSILTTLKSINSPQLKSSSSVYLPIFEKSLNGGEGDRLSPSEWVQVNGPVDVFVMEGWCMGFSSISFKELRAVWEGSAVGENMRGWCMIEDIKAVNERLKEYERFWEMFDAFIQIKPPPNPPSAIRAYDIIYRWRLEQEHNMKARNGGTGMSDEQVVSFVERYIPGYIFFSSGIMRGSLLPTGVGDGEEEQRGEWKKRRWIGKGLVVMIGELRELVGVENF